MLIDSRYEVIEKLGASVWASVYKVRDLRTDGIYALKLYQNLDSKTFYEKFSAEDMFIITKISHPNLLKVYNFGNFDNHIYLLSEFYEGSTLSDFKFSTTNLEDLYLIIIQICYGLHELHGRGIIHKDLKPDNIMYRIEDSRIEVKILDFGFSKVDLEKSQQHISGTLPYIAPELFRGKLASAESDFYSLGVTLYKVVTGTLPYSLEQLSDIITGTKTSIFPKFPTELNPTVPAKLEKLILKMMEKTSEERFHNSYSIISYINRIQNKQFKISWKYSLINSIQHTSYLLREDYTHQLLEYLPLIKKKSGKVIVVSGEQGSGKNSILTLFRYHLLSDEYYLFDFTCTPLNRHPFFALMKEFLSALRGNKEISQGLKDVSNYLRQYLVDSDDDNRATTVSSDKTASQKSSSGRACYTASLKEPEDENQLPENSKDSDRPDISGQKDLSTDYSFAEKFIEKLSEERPLIYIIRVGHNLSDETIGFINRISSTVKKNRILIILSLDNPGLISCTPEISYKGKKGMITDGSCNVASLIHTVHIPIMPLSLKVTKAYVKYLLGVTPPDDYCRNLLARSNGNPRYIREILVDLIIRKELIKTGDKDEYITPENDGYQRNISYNFSFNWDDYELPDTILHNIYNKLSHLSASSYRALHSLSIVFTPLYPELIRYLLNIGDKELFFLISDCINNHILKKDGDYYFFSYPEAKERLFDETGYDTKLEISKRVLEYFDDKVISQIIICEGLIKSARIANDIQRIRKYSLLLARLHTNAGNREESFELICNVIALNFSKEMQKDTPSTITSKDMLNDLALFQETAELTGKIRVALQVFNSIDNMPDIFEKYYIRGILNNASENYRAGLSDLEKSLSKAITGKQRIYALINLVWANINLKDHAKAQEYLDILDKLEMSLELKVAYTDRKAIFLFNTGRVKEAIKLMEDFKSEIQPVESPSFYAKIGSFYNNLALFYSSLKSYDEAEQYFTMAKNIWEQINYKRSLGMSYNNLGDLSLRQGKTAEALDYFSKALEVCKPIENLKCQVLTYLNFGEAYIKLGKFQEAENFLLQAKSIMAETKDKSFHNSIIHNLAIAKNKTISFNNYYSFLKENTPALLSGKIETINPLVKTYCQFLLDIGDINKVSNMLIKNTKLDYSGKREDEFYHQIAGLILMKKDRYADALSHLHHSLSYAENNRSSYAQSIIYCKIAECYIAMNNSVKAAEACKSAEKLIRRFKYSYWALELRLIKTRIDMLDENINLRFILRSLLNILEQAKQQQLYLLEIDTYHYLSLVYRELKSKKKENYYRKLYFNTANKVVENIPKTKQKMFLDKIAGEYEKSLTTDPYRRRHGSVIIADKPAGMIIAKRTVDSFEPWQEHLYELLKLEETERMQFFIKKMLIKMFAPHFFSLFLLEDESKELNPFISYRFDNSIQENTRHRQSYKESLRKNEIMTVVINGCNTMYIPLRFKSIVVGCLVIGDNGELPFIKRELSLAKELRLHLTALLIRIRDITAIEKKTDQMHQLMASGNEIFSLKDVDKIEQEMVSFSIDFTGCTRAFLIKKDNFGNFVYEVAMDSSKNIINTQSHISKTVLSEVYNREQYIYTLNAVYDSTLKNSISVQDYRLHSIYCAPIVIEKDIHGLLYLDNVGDEKIDLQVNIDLMDIFILQMSIALKNAKQYASLMKKNRELHYLDTAKTEFMAIISHELNTPLTTLQNYIGQLREKCGRKQSRSEKVKQSEANESNELFNAVDISLAKIIDKVNDIFSFTKYSLLSKIQKAKVDIKSLLEIIISEAEIISKSRKMMFKLEVKENLPPLEANWESLYLMIYQIVLNAIRFTKDFGTIQIGARKSSFRDEEIDNKESLVIYIQDNGLGIPSKDLKNIFIPFKELNDLYSHQSGTIEFRSSGLGLGLSTAKRIVELHSGKINIKSKEGEGTTVFIILPYSTTEHS